MPNGGLTTEQERKASLNAKQNQARRQSSTKKGGLSQWMSQKQQELERKSIENVIKSRTSAALHGGRRPNLSLTSFFANRLIDRKLDQTWNQEMLDEQAQNSENQPQQKKETPVESQRSSDQIRKAALDTQQNQKRKAQIEQSNLAEMAADKAREQTRKVVRKTLRRGFDELVEFITEAFDFGTSVSLVVTIFIHAFTLTDLNLQMFWGHYMKKGKSFLFPPLDSWDPIPISNNILPIIVLHIGLVVVDALIILLALFLLLTFIIITFGPVILGAAVVGMVIAELASFFSF